MRRKKTKLGWKKAKKEEKNNRSKKRRKQKWCIKKKVLSPEEKLLPRGEEKKLNRPQKGTGNTTLETKK